MIRDNFVCKVRYKGGEDADRCNWELLDLQMVPR